jgi:hypothetical protein
MRQPPRYEEGSPLGQICKFDKALYGLKQAPRVVFSILVSVPSSSLLVFLPPSVIVLFFLQQRGVSIFMLVYVDDTVVSSSS